LSSIEVASDKEPLTRGKDHLSINLNLWWLN